MSKKLTLTLAQLNPVMGDITYNTQKILDAWKSCDTDLIIFPELFLSGYPPEDLVVKPSFLDAIEKALEKICQDSKEFKAAALVPAPQRANGKIFNAAHLIEKGKIVASVQKYHLPNYSVFDEMRVFSSAPLPQPMEFRGHKLGVMICEDMWFSNIAEHLKKQGAEILIVPNGSPFVAGKHGVRIGHAKARVAETGLPLVYLNQVGGQDDIVFDGSSFIMDANGHVTFQMQAFEEQIAAATYPFIHQASAVIPGDTELVYRALVLGLRDYIRKNGFSGVLLGLSGGVDSALSAVIAVDALGTSSVHCFMLPSKYTSEESFHDAAALANTLGIKLDTIPIEQPVEAFNTILKPYLEGASGVTFENIQPRARGVILMALSNATGNMVLSTGNKSEMAVGYATLYGDMCGGFNVLKDIYKTQVYELARWRNHDDHIIPERTLTRAATAELRPNQTDQDTLPDYAQLDAILKGLIEADLSPEDLIKKGHAASVVTKVQKMLDNAEYKRRQSAPGIKVTEKAFGRDRRYPITNRFAKNIEK